MLFSKSMHPLGEKHVPFYYALFLFRRIVFARITEKEQSRSVLPGSCRLIPGKCFASRFQCFFNCCVACLHIAEEIDHHRLFT